MSIRFQMRHGDPSAWVAANPILAQGEPGLEHGTGKGKVGNGVDAWFALPYVIGPISGGGGTARSLNIYNLRDDYGAAMDGTTDDFPKLSAAYTDAKAAGGGTIYAPGAKYLMNGNLVLDDPRVNILGDGTATIFQPSAHGSFLTVKVLAAAFNPDQQANRLSSFLIDGTHAQSDTVGMQVSDTADVRLMDVGFYNLVGASAQALLIKNVGTAPTPMYTEGLILDGVEFSNNTVGIMCDRNTGTDDSQGYHSWLDVRMDIAAGQTGIWLKNGVRLYGGHFRVKANLNPNSATTFAKIDGITGVGDTSWAGFFDVAVEQTGGSPGTAKGIVMSEFGLIDGFGKIDLSGNSPQSSIGTGNTGIVTFEGQLRAPGFPSNIFPLTSRLKQYTIGNPATHFGSSITGAVGDQMYELTPVSGGFIGWVCIAAGTPGTWKSFGPIS